MALNGMEWLVDIFGCPADVLQDRRTMSALFNTVVREMRLHPMGDPVWHQFPTTKGMTGFWMLLESHMTIHTFPEYESACFNLLFAQDGYGLAVYVLPYDSGDIRIYSRMST